MWTTECNSVNDFQERLKMRTIIPRNEMIEKQLDNTSNK